VWQHLFLTGFVGGGQAMDFGIGLVVVCVVVVVCQHWEYLGTCMLTKAVLLGSQTTMS
jgi:type III secretory pathway component EscS